jgi:hypothetical protein
MAYLGADEARMNEQPLQSVCATNAGRSVIAMRFGNLRTSLSEA